MAGRPLGNENGSLIFLPERGFFAFTSFQSLIWPSLSFGSSSLISRRRQSFALSRARFRPPGNIHNRSRLRLTRSTRPRFDATSFEDLAMRPLVDTESAVILTQVSLEAGESSGPQHRFHRTTLSIRS